MSNRYCATACQIILGLVFIGGCASQRPPAPSDLALSTGAPAPVTADTSSFMARLDAHMDRPAADRDRQRTAAEELARDWRAFEREAQEAYDRVYRRWWYVAMPRFSSNRLGVGLGNSVQELRGVVDTDPSFAEAWGALGHLCLEAGDLESGSKYLQRARIAARAQREAGRPLPLAEELRIHRNLAWSLRDLARWDEGLAAVENGYHLDPHDQELDLIRGLLLADQGRFSEALSAAVHLEPMHYRQRDFIFKGIRFQKSSYANNWIRAMAYLVDGDVAMAYRLLGDLDLYSYRGRLPLADRYWRDVGLVAELAGDPRAPLWYAMGHISRAYLGYFPITAQNVAPQVLDLPDPQMPCYTSFGSRFYVGGSPLTYVAGQMNLMSMASFERQRNQAAGRALQMLDILQQRRIRPEYCQALRGRIYFANDDFALARSELDSARTLFAARGEVEPVTSMISGLLALRDGRWSEAEASLEETVAADPERPAAWRSLGVARARLGDNARARSAFDQAVEQEPGSMANYYNRGLFHLNQGSFNSAVADLDRAYRLEPGNREVQRLLQTAVSGARASGDVVTVQHGPPDGFHTAPDSLLADLDAQVQELFTLPDSLRLDTAAATAHIVELERAYAVDGDPGLRTVLALAYLDHGRFREVQLLLGPGWGLDLLPEEELMLLYADRHLGELARAADLAEQLLSGGAGAGNPYLLALTAMIIRNDPRAGQSEVDRIFLNYSKRSKAKTYGFPEPEISRYMRDGFSSAREYRARHDIPDAPVIRDEFGLTEK